MRSFDALVGRTDDVINGLYRTEPFQRQRYNLQLGFSDTRYPYEQDPVWDVAYRNYPRLAHMAQCYMIGIDCMKRLESEARGSGRTQGADLELAGELLLALYAHDVGHGHTSHAIEGICGFDHERNGSEIMLSGSIAPIIEAGGFDPDAVAGIFCDRLRPYSDFLTSDIGVDRLAYVTADTIASGQKADFSELENNLMFDGGGFYLREGTFTDTMLQWFLHQRAVLIETVYGSPANRSMSTMYRAVFRKGMEEGLIALEDAIGTVLPQQYELLGSLKDPRAKAIEERLSAWYPFYGVDLIVGSDQAAELERMRLSDERESVESEIERRLGGGAIALLDTARLPGRSKLDFMMEREGELVRAGEVIRPEVESLIDWSRSKLYAFVDPDTWLRRPRHLERTIAEVCGVDAHAKQA